MNTVFAQESQEKNNLYFKMTYKYRYKGWDDFRDSWDLGLPTADRRGRITPSDIRDAINEIKQAGLWPWKGSGIE